MRRIGYQNAVLTVIAAFLGIGLVERATLEPADAQAQPLYPDQGGMSNALEQRKQIISELRSMNSRLDRIESKLASGLTVKVSEMPPIRLPEPKAEAKPGAKPETKIEVVRPPDGK